MKNKYLIRLDDACPTMDSHKWNCIEELLDAYSIRPMVGVIPHNEDPGQQIECEDKHFWNKVHKWQNKGWTIALHGFNHCYISDASGINPLWNRSEFAGIPLEHQKYKIREGVSILRKHNINPQYFFAPSHTFDDNTLIALRDESDIRIISDTIAVKPYQYGDFVFIPQLGGQCKEMPLKGIWTFCLHPTTMNEDAFKNLDKFISNHKSEFIGFSDLDLSQIGKKDLLSKILSFAYFQIRKLRNR